MASVTHLQRELERLKRKILGLGAVVEQSLHLAFEAIELRDDRRAQRVNAMGDFEIDELEVEVEEECLKILALYRRSPATCASWSP